MVSRLRELSPSRRLSTNLVGEAADLTDWRQEVKETLAGERAETEHEKDGHGRRIVWARNKRTKLYIYHISGLHEIQNSTANARSTLMQGQERSEDEDVCVIETVRMLAAEVERTAISPLHDH